MSHGEIDPLIFEAYLDAMVQEEPAWAVVWAQKRPDDPELPTRVSRTTSDDGEVTYWKQELEGRWSDAHLAALASVPPRPISMADALEDRREHDFRWANRGQLQRAGRGLIGATYCHEVEGALVFECFKNPEDGLVLSATLDEQGGVTTIEDMANTTIKNRPASEQSYVLQPGTNETLRRVRYTDDKTPRSAEIPAVGSDIMVAQVIAVFERIERISKNAA